MNEKIITVKELSVWDRIVGIFTSPKETFESINQKPNWIIPFIIGLIFFFIFQFVTMDIQMEYQIANIDAKDTSAEQIEMAKNQMQGPMKYLGLFIGPIAILIIWVVFAACFLLFGNWMIGGDTNFKKIFSIVAWSSLVGNLSLLLLTFLIVSKGTMHGVALDLSILFPTPEIGAEKSLIYLLFSKIDFFVIWQVILWIIGLSVAYNTTTKKAAVPILSLWAIWIVISVTFSSVFGNMF